MIEYAGMWFSSVDTLNRFIAHLQLQDLPTPRSTRMETRNANPVPERAQDDFGKLEQRYRGVEAGQSSRRMPEGARFPVNGEAIAMRQVEELDFGQALRVLRAGERVARSGWNGRGQYIELQRPDTNSKMTLPYIYIRTVQGDLVPWLASQTDLLAQDWVIVTERTQLVYGTGVDVVSRETPLRG